ncbi:MAG TPA: hypothetical protein VGT02_06605 [Methylomirabilota bacterium]|jgi:hypothetical protein|nr:hypothetical protein [Methylomirabilota bacterium]
MRQRRLRIVTLVGTLTLLLGVPVLALPPGSGPLPQFTVSLVSTSPVVGGARVNGRVRLSTPGDVSVGLSTSDPAAATIAPASVTVTGRAGTTADFTVNTLPVGQSTTVTIRATAAGDVNVTKTAQLTVTAPVLSSIALTPKTVTGGQNAQAQLSLNGPAPSRFVVELSSSDPAVAAVPPSVPVREGARVASFPVTTVKVGQPATVTITARIGKGHRSAALKVNPSPTVQ